MVFGSKVYGTNLPTSDTDYKGIFVPDAQDLVMQRAAKFIKRDTKTSSSAKNTSNDIDDELVSIQTFMEFVRQGQTVALDMLFTPEQHWVSEPDSLWHALIEHRKNLIHSGTNAFVGYTKAQASKFGMKGDRLGALNKTMELLSHMDERCILQEYAKTLDIFLSDHKSKEIERIDIPTPAGRDLDMIDVPHMSIANKKVSYNCSVAYAKEVYQQAINKYGHRAKSAEVSGVDWKSCMHAVRIAYEAEELLLTGHITFPRPERELLLRIRQGQESKESVEELIDHGLERIQEAEQISTLPKKPNYSLIEKIVSDAHWSAINGD